jgi:phenylpyruvate tautomerase PptA (4-oxalocrotonate tautomerase family)
MAGKAPLIAAISAASVAVVAASAAVIVVTTNANRDEPLTQIDDAAVPRVAYATEGVTVVEDSDELSRMVQEMYDVKRDMMALSYKNDAYGENGRDFQCYIANAPGNEYDMYIAIYADEEYSELLFLSKLLRPGTAFERLELERALEKGDHTVYVAFTQVEEDDDGKQAIHAQSRVTMTFHVV